MVKISSKIKEKIKELPESPGIYKFLGKNREIIYVGKAKRLKKRVASYFQPGRAHDARMELLINEVRDIKFICASSESEALIYEAGLIKDHRPRFNVDLKDDKSYPFLKLTVDEKFPRIVMTRRKLKDGAVYYGPYVNVKLLKEAVSFMKRVFPMRSCRNMRKKVCLEYHIGQCAGPCEGKISPEEYRKTVDQLRAFLEGRKDDLLKDLKQSMKAFSREHEYEKALSIKKRIEALTSVRELRDQSNFPMFGELEELQSVLNMKNLPYAIECFDISNTGGGLSVGAMVRFEDGKPVKASYRKFKIRNVDGVDDYAMIREVVRRRYSRIKSEGAGPPDLVLIDGGRGHLSSAQKEIDGLKVNTVVASIAKEFNHLYSRDKRYPVKLSPGSRVLHLIQRVRDEAHRFAIRYHRTLREKKVFYTGLRSIDGIGPLKEKLLLEKFKKTEKVQKATLKQLIDSGIGNKTAKAVYEYFHATHDA